MTDRNEALLKCNIEGAARRLASARRSGNRLRALAEDMQPADFADAAAIQETTIRLLDERVAGYKVAGTEADTVMWGAVLGSRLFDTPARIDASSVPLLGVEGEIAFQLGTDYGMPEKPLTLEQFDAMVTVRPCIEVVDSRFADYKAAPLLHRAADLMSNGALVCGRPWTECRISSLTELEVTLRCDDTVLLESVGGHPAKDPRLPALAFLNSKNRPFALPRGTIITTGTYTGLHFARPGQTLEVAFRGYGTVSVAFI